VATVDVFRRLAEVAKLKGMVGINVDGESGRVIPFTNKVPEAIADQLTRNLNSNLEDDRALLALWSALTAVNMIKPNGSVLSKLSKALSSVVAKLSAVSGKHLIYLLIHLSLLMVICYFRRFNAFQVSDTTRGT